MENKELKINSEEGTLQEVITPISDILEKNIGTNIEGVFYIASCETKTTKTNKPYTDLVLTDGSATIDAKIWETSLVVPKGYNAIEIMGKIGEFNGKLQLTLNKHNLVYRDLSDAKTPVNVNESVRQLKEILGMVEDKEFRELIQVMVLRTIDEEDDLFRIAPAASTMHHNYRSGLLRHTLETVRIAYNIARAYHSYINTDLVITGALLHDIGKTKVYLIDGFEVGRDEYQGLQEHLYIGTQMVMEHKEIFKDNPIKLDLLINIIGSHHGTLEWGSLFEPATQEAEIVHLADMASARIEAIEKNARNTEDDLIKSSYSGMFKHKLSPRKVRQVMKGEMKIGN